jgi:MFS family permease
VDGTIKRTFAAFEIRNFRLFYLGQGISLCGTWMQAVGLSWLVLRLTHSGTQLGLVLAAQFLPVLLLGVWGGVIADRFNKRHILYVTQTLAGILALILGLLVVTHTIQIWMIYVLAATLGLVSVADNPTRQSFVIEMVGEEHVRNAVTLNSTLVNTARVIGPSIAGLLIATVGIGLCFLINAASYIAVVVALYMMRSNELHTVPPSKRERGQIRAGLEYAWSVPKIRSTLIMMFIVGTFAYEFPVVLPLFATKTLHGDAATYSALTAAMGVGAIIGGIYTAGRANSRDTQLMWIAVIFGIAIIATAISPTFLVAVIVMVVVGVLSVIFIALGNTTLQLTSAPQMRGRVMALWSIAFLGTTPIGGPIIGFISDNLTPRVGLATGGVSAITAGALALWVFKRQNKAVPLGKP